MPRVKKNTLRPIELSRNTGLFFLGATCPQTPWVGFAETWVINGLLAVFAFFLERVDYGRRIDLFLTTEFFSWGQPQTPGSASPSFVAENRRTNAFASFLEKKNTNLHIEAH
jgi:hypothetical protein